jgi:hypothetical protein
MSVERQTRKSYDRINQDETAAAQHEGKVLASEKKFSDQMAEQNSSERAQAAETLLNPYSMFGYGGYGGGYHVHYHLHH